MLVFFFTVVNLCCDLHNQYNICEYVGIFYYENTIDNFAYMFYTHEFQ